MRPCWTSAGRCLERRASRRRTPGYQQLLDWLSSFGEVDVVAIESTGSYAAALVRYLRERDIPVVEVNQLHAHTRRRVGKSDPIDAEMAARLLLAGKAKAIPKRTDGIVESIRMLRVARNSAVKSRTAATVQIRDLIITAPQQLRDQLSCRKTLRRQGHRLRTIPTSGQELHSPSQSREVRACDPPLDESTSSTTRSTALDHQLEQLVATAAPRTIQLLGISTGHAGQLLVTAGQNIDRLHGESSFSMLCGASPIPASSGKTTRHRLNYGGDRQANRALHLIAVCRLRYCDRTREYVKRRTAEGKTQREIMRCLKRYIAREIFNALRDDLADTELPRPVDLDHHHVRQPRLRNQPNPHLTFIGTSRNRGRRPYGRSCDLSPDPARSSHTGTYPAKCLYLAALVLERLSCEFVCACGRWRDDGPRGLSSAP